MRTPTPALKRKPSNQEPNYKVAKDRSYGYIVLAVLGFFVGIIASSVLYQSVVIDFIQLSKFIGAFLVVGFLLPMKYYSKWFNFIKYEVIVFNVLGLAPVLTALFLLTNSVFSHSAVTHELKIERVEVDQDNRTINIILEDKDFGKNDKLIKMSAISPKAFTSTHYQITIAEGLWGYDVIQDREFLKK